MASGSSPCSRATCARVRRRGLKQVDVLQLRGVPAVADAPLQFGRELLLLGDGLEDRRLALLQLLELRVEFADACDLHLVEIARPLLAVACDEGDGEPSSSSFSVASTWCSLMDRALAICLANGFIVL